MKKSKFELKQPNKSKLQMGSPERFGYEWNKFNKILPEYEDQFIKWSFPLTKEDFKGKKVFDGGCGIGRNSYWCLKYGAKEIFAFDCDDRSVAFAKKNLSKFKNATVEYGSLYDPKPKNENKFDISFSIGVIHHLEEPRKGIKTLVKATKPGGLVYMFVYGYEGIGSWVVKYINPIRRITSKLPPTLTKFISYFFSIPLYFYLKIFPHKIEYFKQLSGFSFKNISLIVCDQLLPRIANYWTKEEALDLFKDQGLEDIKIYHINEMSWTVMGKKAQKTKANEK